MRLRYLAGIVFLPPASLTLHGCGHALGALKPASLQPAIHPSMEATPLQDCPLTERALLQRMLAAQDRPSPAQDGRCVLPFYSSFWFLISAILFVMCFF